MTGLKMDFGQMFVDIINGWQKTLDKCYLICSILKPVVNLWLCGIVFLFVCFFTNILFSIMKYSKT